MTLRFKASSLIITLALMTIYVLGGLIQFVGIASQTATNYLALFLMLLYLIKQKRFLRFSVIDVLFLTLLIVLLISGYLNSKNHVDLAVYFYYFACFYLAINTAKILSLDLSSHNNYLIKLFSYIHIFLIFQLFVSIAQWQLAPTIAENSSVPLLPVDVISGTFFIKSDASLSFFAILTTITCFSLKLKSYKKYSILLISAIICLIGNSVTAFTLMLTVFPIIIVHELMSKLNMAKPILILSPLLIILMALYFQNYLLFMFDYFSDFVLSAFDARYRHETANRFAPIGDMLYGNITFFGLGPLTYHNPIRDSWIYYSGHSLIYSLYYDLGLIGLLLVSIILLYFINYSRASFFYKLIYSATILLYSLFNFFLSDLSIAFILFFYMYIQRIYSVEHSKNFIQTSLQLRRSYSA